MFRSVFFISSLLILIAAATRLLPHPANFTPLIAISLFAGAYIQNRYLAAIVPILAMTISDLILGYHDLLIPIYGIMVGITFLGRGLQTNRHAIRVGTFTITGSLGFFLASNFLVWLTSGMYTLNLAGFIQCYIMAIPFYQNQLIGDLFFSASLFGTMHLIERSSLIPVRVTVKH